MGLSVKNRRWNTHQGFSLIELIVALAIVAILVSIAVPAYQDTIAKSNRTDGKTALTAAASRQEQFFMDNKTYASSVVSLGYATAEAPTAEGKYKIKMLAATSACVITNCYVLSVTEEGSWGDNDACATMTLDSIGVGTPVTCW